jgi:hypothetical protein
LHSGGAWIFAFLAQGDTQMPPSSTTIFWFVVVVVVIAFSRIVNSFAVATAYRRREAALHEIEERWRSRRADETSIGHGE